ncbi:MAG: alanine racemase [Gammaproteobacteria bacterium]|nr:alanine racemase [Gammaproteobacteria bacterium]
MTRPARLVLSAAALRRNFKAVQSRANDAHIYAVVKANAYGHGIVWAARVLNEAGARAFAVACMEEAVCIREAGLHQRVLLLAGAVDDRELSQVLGYGFDLVVHRQEQVEALLRRDVSCGGLVWIKIDTGMGRLGFPAHRAAELWRQLKAHVGVGRVGLMTHLANADDPDDPVTADQVSVFHSVSERLPGVFVSVLNSAGLLMVSKARGDWVRPGIMLYGVCPVAGKAASDYGLTPVARFESALIDVKPLPKGARIGYGGTTVLERDSRIGVVAAGYGDGYPRGIAAGTPVIVAGAAVPIVGRVSMDMLTVDLTDCPNAALGDRVLLWGGDLSVEAIAARANTIGYELLCRVTNRVVRTTGG